MNLDLSDEQAAVLLHKLDQIIDGDRYFHLEGGGRPWFG
jgi:hypothetical protein